MKLSTSTCDIRGEKLGTADSLRLLAGTKFRYFNVYFSGANERLNGDDWERKVAAVAAAAKETGAGMVLAHAVCGSRQMEYNGLVEESARAVRACGTLGIPDCVVHPLYDPALSSRDVFAMNRQYYLDIFSCCPGTTVHILTENSGDTEMPGQALSSGAELASFLDFTGEDRLGVCWDTAHCGLNRPPMDDQYRNIMTLGRAVRALHVSDNFADGRHWHSFPYNGVLNFDSILCALLDSGYQGYFNFEAPYIVRESVCLPALRKPWDAPPPHTGETRLMEPPVRIKLAAEDMLYEIGRWMLEQYGVFEA